MTEPDVARIEALDLPGWDDPSLELLGEEVAAERQRRRVLATAPALADEIAAQYAAAIGRTDGAAWVQPTGGHDAYRAGAIVVHDGTRWRSTTPANVWPPGTGDLWEEIPGDTDPAPEPDAAAWEPGIAYIQGDRVDYDGNVYVVVQDHTSAAHWPPDQVPALYSPA